MLQLEVGPRAPPVAHGRVLHGRRERRLRRRRRSPPVEAAAAVETRGQWPEDLRACGE